MNRLFVGADRSGILRDLPENFLLIDDGALIAELEERHPRPRQFDISKHSFNPLAGLDYKRARDFVSVMDAAFPQGESTLTRRYSTFVLLQRLLASTRHSKPRTLSTLFPTVPSQKDTGATDAYQKIATLLLSPVLKSVLDEDRRFPFDGSIVVRLNRAEIGDFDAFVIANLLVSNYQGHVVIPDFGFYACPFHSSLIRQERLIAGVNFLDEAKGFRERLLLIKDKHASGCTADDAETLADYCSGFPRGTEGYNAYVEHAIQLQ